MKGTLGKYEPVWIEHTDDGKKTKIRALKLSIYTDVGEFPNVTAYDGAQIHFYTSPPTGDNTLELLHDKLDAATALLLEIGRVVKDRL